MVVSGKLGTLPSLVVPRLGWEAGPDINFLAPLLTYKYPHIAHTPSPISTPKFKSTGPHIVTYHIILSHTMTHHIITYRIILYHPKHPKGAQ